MNSILGRIFTDDFPRYQPPPPSLPLSLALSGTGGAVKSSSGGVQTSQLGQAETTFLDMKNSFLLCFALIAVTTMKLFEPASANPVPQLLKETSSQVSGVFKYQEMGR